MIEDYPCIRWSCWVESPQYGSVCPNFAFTDGALLTYPPGSFPANAMYSIRVRVTNSYGSSSSASVRLTIVPYPTPGLRVDALPSRYINRGDQVVLTSRISCANNCSAMWTAEDLELGQVALTPLVSSGIIGNAVFQLSFSSASLLAGRPYLFRISAYFTSARTALAANEIRLQVNSAPQNGVLSVQPSSGQAVLTLFSFSSSGWVDSSSDLPLSYGFYFRMSANDSNIFLISKMSAKSTAVNYLVQGLRTLRYKLWVEGRVTDCYNAENSAVQTVLVSPLSGFFNVDKYGQLGIANGLNASAGETAGAAVAGTLAFLNSADCSAVPSAFCMSLNRQVCDVSAGLCGACYPGYIGTDGPSNLPCVPMSDPIARSGSPCIPSSGGRSGHPGHCVTGVCLNGTCTDMQKLCPGNCSGQGTCGFFLGSGARVSTCPSSEASCRPRCLCQGGFFGRDCSIRTLTYFNQWIAVRTALCFSLLRLGSLEDVTNEVLVSRVSTLTWLLLEPAQLTLAALRACSAALLESISACPSCFCQGNGRPVALQALSRLLRAAPWLQANVSMSLQTLALACQDQMALGQPTLDMVSDSIRLRHYVLDRRTQTQPAVSVSGALTQLEAALGRPPPALSLLLNRSQTDTPLPPYLKISVATLTSLSTSSDRATYLDPGTPSPFLPFPPSIDPYCH